MLLTSKAAGDDRKAEPEKTVADDRAGDLRLDDVCLPRLQYEQRDDQLSCVSEGDIEETADR